MKNWILLPALLLVTSFVTAADLPPQGMSMAKVQKMFGAPIKKVAAVGKPPITRWVYSDYTVVFEYKHVVQSVRLLNENQAVPQIQQGTTTTVAPNEATINVEVKP